jgi:predicted transglutaminase-like cysteine proteinase
MKTSNEKQNRVTSWTKAAVVVGSMMLWVNAGAAERTNYTPYDNQMERVQSYLTMAQYNGNDGPEMKEVNNWMQDVRRIRYQYSAEWQTPGEVDQTRRADCKGKAVKLYAMLKENGARNVKLVIGKQEKGRKLSHAWVIWEYKGVEYLLDPTFYGNAWPKSQFFKSQYVPLYAYSSEGKYTYPQL